MLIKIIYYNTNLNCFPKSVVCNFENVDLSSVLLNLNLIYNSENIYYCLEQDDQFGYTWAIKKFKDKISLCDGRIIFKIEKVSDLNLTLKQNEEYLFDFENKNQTGIPHESFLNIFANGQFDHQHIDDCSDCSENIK